MYKFKVAVAVEIAVNEMSNRDRPRTLKNALRTL